MRFYVIYSFDILRELSVQSLKPPFIKRWTLTEQDDQYDYDYLGKEYENGKHRKYVAELSKKQFKQFIEEQSLYCDEVETMGSLTEFGLLPAISYRSDDDDHYIINQSAYVTPLPEHCIKGKHLEKSQNEKNWKRIKQALLNVHGFNQTYYEQTYKTFHFGFKKETK